MTSRRAYTLLEILIVLALISLIGAIAIPNLGIINNIKEKQEFSELKRDLMYLRNKAITENCFYEVHIDVDKNRYRMGINTDQSLVKSKVFSSGLKFINTKETTTDLIKFGPSGAPSVAGSFVIQRKNGDKYLFSFVVASGKINISLIK